MLAQEIKNFDDALRALEKQFNMQLQLLDSKTFDKLNYHEEKINELRVLLDINTRELGKLKENEIEYKFLFRKINDYIDSQEKKQTDVKEDKFKNITLIFTVLTFSSFLIFKALEYLK